jgi:hypothetical protein
METLEILQKARALLEQPEGWTRGVLARDSLGRSAPVTSDDACSFCMNGAIIRAAGGFGDAAWLRACRAVEKAAGGDNIGFNDNPRRKHADVLAAFDRAIAALSSAPSTEPQS